MALNIGVIGIRGAWSTESLSQHLQAKGAGGQIVELHELSHDLATGCLKFGALDVSAFDGFIVKKMGKRYSPNLREQLELLAMMERRGVRFFSSPRAIQKMISRLACTLTLNEHHLPMPPTFVTEAIDDAIAWAADKFPVILKPLYSTKARGMALLTDPVSARDAMTQQVDKGETVLYLQQKCDIDGADYGLVFLGGEFLGAYARVGDGSAWHTTTQEGGKYGTCNLDPEIIELARQAQAPFGLDFTCVDVAITREHGPVVFEVSAFGGYKGLYKATGLDASDLLTDHVIRRLRDQQH
ncbi:MAG: GAK system ATP-grasp enzyme [Pseudomonadales bacterium]|nr:GAK system ATP-grasp enzyme [Pseudomonadales bacterium]